MASKKPDLNPAQDEEEHEETQLGLYSKKIQLQLSMFLDVTGLVYSFISYVNSYQILSKYFWQLCRSRQKFQKKKFQKH